MRCMSRPTDLVAMPSFDPFAASAATAAAR
jgi:hypothetical protein